MGPAVVPVVPLEKFLAELLGAVLGAAPVPVQLASAMPALMQTLLRPCRECKV